MLEAILFAHEAIKPQCRAQLELSEEVGKMKKREYCHECMMRISGKGSGMRDMKKYTALQKTTPSKHERHEALEKVRTDFVASFPEGTEVNEKAYHPLFS